MNRKYVTARCLALLCLLFCMENAFSQQIKANLITASEAVPMYRDGAVFIDTRSTLEQEIFGRVKAALHYRQRQPFITTLEQETQGNKDANLVVYCARGVRATDLASYLSKLGYTNIQVVAFNQGFSQLKKAGLPTE